MGGKKPVKPKKSYATSSKPVGSNSTTSSVSKTVAPSSEVMRNHPDLSCEVKVELREDLERTILKLVQDSERSDADVSTFR